MRLPWAEWSELDLEAKTWTFRPEKDQSHIQRTHVINLSDFALKQFKRLFGVTGSSKWLYPDTTNVKPVCKKSITKQIGDRQRTDALQNSSKLTGSLLLSGGTWTPHDLRRTAATIMRTLGISREVTDRALTILNKTNWLAFINVTTFKRKCVRRGACWVIGLIYWPIGKSRIFSLKPTLVKRLDNSFVLLFLPNLFCFQH